MIKPRILKPGCRIGVLSPSYWLKKKDLEKTKPSGEHDEELLDIPRFLRRQDPDLDF